CSTTSQKHRNFVSEPMGNRSVRDVPGSDLYRAAADQMLGQYLVSGRDQGRFQGYLKNTTGANAKQQSDAYNGMRDWTDNNM
uniref:Exc2 family lipoprotein n=1 Tax=Oncorhynchus tshawytscha TaxID=74940 RepID=A0A8C8C424_ONCTS